MKCDLRVTAVALLKKGLGFEDIEGFIDAKLADPGTAGFNTLRKTIALADGTQRLYVKFSKVMPDHELDDGWNLHMTRDFYRAGYGNVAWKITRIDPQDANPEATTESFPAELFQSCLEDTAETHQAPDDLPAPFGSDAFWEWIEDDSK
jgi:hypothetical protein